MSANIKNEMKELLSVIKFEPSPDTDWLVYRYSESKFNSGSKLIVGQGQRAICVHLGIIEGEFKPGVTIMDTENYPFLNKFVEKIYGGKPLFTFEIYFINTTIKSKREWGTKKPILVKDPETGLLVHARGYGSYNFRLVNSQFLLQMMLGTFNEGGLLSFSAIQDDFDDKVQEAIQTILGTLIINEKTSVLEISLKTKEFSICVKNEIYDYFAKYGFELIDFNTSSLSILDDDINAYKKKKEYDVFGTSHITERQLNVSEKLAGNEGAAGTMISAGLGFGIGASIYNDITRRESNQTKPISGDSEKIICSFCNATILKKFKFCPECGNRLMMKCKKCGNSLLEGAKFCPECGERVGV